MTLFDSNKATPPPDIEGAARRLREALGLNKTCSYCKRSASDVPVRLHNSRTAYAWDGIGENPNADVLLCAECADAYNAYWDDMWREYYASRR
jgi:hypothetical protein